MSSSPVLFGSPPSRRTSTLVESDSNQITGRMSFANPFSTGATVYAKAALRWMARRLGTSSPSTSDR